MCNVGKMDALVRFIVGVLAIVIGMFIGGLTAWIAGIVGVVLMATAVFNFCPIYTIIKANTCKK